MCLWHAEEAVLLGFWRGGNSWKLCSQPRLYSTSLRKKRPSVRVRSLKKAVARSASYLDRARHCSVGGSRSNPTYREALRNIGDQRVLHDSQLLHAGFEVVA